MGRKQKESVCDRDCLNCVYPDCVLDEGPNAAEYRQMAEMEKELFRTSEQKKVAAQQKAYREANREKVAAQQKAYYEANREAYNEYMRNYLREKRREICPGRIWTG